MFILHSAYYCSHSVFSAVVFLFSLCVSLFSLRFFLRASRSPAVHREFDVYDWALLFALTLGHQVPTGRAERPSTTKNGCEALIFIRLWLHVQQNISETLCFGTSALNSHQKPYVFEGRNVELREGSLLGDRQALNFERCLNFEQKGTPPWIPRIPWTPRIQDTEGSSRPPGLAPGVNMI